jgi:hypothetical protein
VKHCVSRSAFNFVALLALLLPALGAAPEAAPNLSEWVHPAADGKLVYKMDARGNRIPDFSNVGYRGGGVELPEVPVRATVEPAAGDAGYRIQAAIDRVSKLSADAQGRRGAVLLKKGRYPIAGALWLRAGGVVLRGEGQGEDGTVLIATGATQRSLIVVGGNEARPPRDENGEPIEPTVPYAAYGQPQAVLDDYAPVGARTFHVDHPNGLSIGDDIVIRRPSPGVWIHAIGMDRIPPHLGEAVEQWTAGSKDLLFNRTVVAIVGNAITIEAPLVNALERRYGGGAVFPARHGGLAREVGVENLRGESEFANPTDERHGWLLVELAAVRDAWVQNVTSVHFGYSCVYVHKVSRAVTITHCSCLDPISQITGGRRYSFELDGQLTLVEHCYARNGRHDYVMHSVAAGPNVFFDCLAEEAHEDSGPHHRWSVGVLYDNVRIVRTQQNGARTPEDGALNIRNQRTAHGWAGANQVAWNCEAYSMDVEQPPTAQNWAIGCRAMVHRGDAYWESFGVPVEPQSLYLAQLRDRLDGGKLAAEK